MDNISKFENKTKQNQTSAMVFSLKYHHVLLLSLLKVASHMQSNAEKMGEVGHNIPSIIHHTKTQYLLCNSRLLNSNC